ncbi:MAG TPA: PAS domain S-box protein, partial [Candidatus Binatia bacterium]|nr:PAS domain S-box protein [Candidatus Binatia bacterium]
GMALVSPQGRFLSVNRSLCRITGYSQAELTELDFQSITHPEDLAADLELVRRTLAGEIDSYQIDKRYIHKQGYVIWILLTVSLVRANGEPVHFIAQIQDVTDRKRAELQLAELNTELEARVRERTQALLEANAELEAFCYSVSHDLRAPLRHINGYAAMMAEECEGQVPPEAEQHLRSISDASRQMGGLIDDLLSFSRAGRAEAAEHELELDELAGEVVAVIRRAAGARAIEWDLLPLPRVLGDRAMIRQVFVNLIDNAVKYTQPQPLARIEISCVGEEEGRAIIAVRDNGVGFDMQYADKLFGVFQRLHHVDEFEGTGVGLANVRRIVARHGGRSWAEAEPGAGASFYFTLALAPPRSS